LTERGLKYFFRLAPTDYHDSVMFFDFLDDMESKGKKVRRVAVTCEKTEFGEHATREVLKQAEKRGYKIVANVPYPFKATDVNAEVLKIKAAKPDVIIQGSVFSEQVLFAKTYRDLGLKTNAILNFCGGYQNPRFASQMGADAEGWAGSCTFAPDFVAKKAHLRKINDMYKAKTNMDMDGIAMECFTTLFVAADAFSRAKSTEREAIAQALRTTELVIETLPGKGVKFAENGQNIWIASTLSQIQNGKYRVVWPADWASSKLWWPMYEKP
jgi:branched-chain amino acid transport system substrate-binding protein